MPPTWKISRETLRSQLMLSLQLEILSRNWRETMKIRTAAPCRFKGQQSFDAQERDCDECAENIWVEQRFSVGKESLIKMIEMCRKKVRKVNRWDGLQGNRQNRLRKTTWGRYFELEMYHPKWFHIGKMAYSYVPKCPYQEKAVATHSSTLAWKIPWTEEPDGLQSMGSQRVGHDWVTSLFSLISVKEQSN